MRWRWVVLVASGCFTKPPAPGQTDDSGTHGGPDSASEPVDGRIRADAVVCMPWSAGPSLGTVNSTSSEDVPAMRPAGDMLAFVSARAGDSDLYVSPRMTSTFSTPYLAIGQTITTVEYGTTWSNSGDALYFTQNGSWFKVTFVSGSFGQVVSDSDMDALSGLKPTFFDQDRGVVFTDNTELYMATRTSPSASFGGKVALSVNDPGANDGDPTITPNGLVLYFTSDRNGGLKRVYRATRPDLASTFDAPQVVGDLPVNVSDLEINATDTEMFYTAGSPTEIFMSSRTCP